MSEHPIRLGTRGSALALAQARSAAAALGEAEIVEIATSGDRGSGPGDKSRFTREIEEALLSGEIEIAVHSAKDVPSELPDGLRIAGSPPRESPADCYVGSAASAAEIAEGTRIGTSSLRRRAQLLALRRDLQVEELRGNVDTRLRKVGEQVDAAVLASAGLRRLGREDEAAFEFGPQELTPAPGQGTLALEVRDEDRRAATAVEAITDRRAGIELAAERAVVRALEASCHTPLGVLARVEGATLELHGFAGLPDGGEWVRDSISAEAADPEGAGGRLAERMRFAGADELLARAQELAR